MSWVDIPTGRVFVRKGDGSIAIERHAEKLTFYSLVEDGSWIGGALHGIIGSRMPQPFRPPGFGEQEELNDGAVHPSGRCLVFGSRHVAETRPSGRMWILGERWVALPHNLVVFNGPAFSPDGLLIYFADSPTGVIWRAAFDIDRLEIGELQPFATVPSVAGYPDGMVCDEEGCVWVAHWDGGRVTRFRHDGSIDRELLLPTTRITSVAFWGANGNRLAITSALPDHGSPQSPGRSTSPVKPLMSRSTSAARAVHA